VVLGAAALLRWDGVLAPLAPFLPAVPALVLALGVGLAVRFGRGRVLLALLTLAVVDRVLALPAGPAGLRQAAALLVPVNLVVLGLLPERGILTAATGRRLAVMAAEGLALVLLARAPELAGAGLLDLALVPARFTRWSPVGDPGLIAYCAGLALLAGWFVRRPHASARGLFWALVAAFLALSAPPAGAAAALAPSTWLLSAGGLVLGLAVIEESHAMAYRDGLTGLESRRALDETLRATAGGFTLAMVDVDHFKRCNDTHGHEVGDQVLRMVAAVLARVTVGARAFRYGGEEFAVLFPGRDLEACLPLLDAARAAVEETTFTLRGTDRPRKRPRQPTRRSKRHTLAVTVSIGVAQRVPAHQPPDDVIRAADEALYRAKHAGRNRVVAAGRDKGRG
jgi:diguanylate cyclase (GGDEF)-like protein